MKNSFYTVFGKRVVDVVVSLIMIVLLSPLFFVLAVTVCIKLGFPIFFRQKRPGKNENIFQLIKFRSMKTSNINIGGKQLCDKDRLTRFGDWLRATSLDELPELWNVLKGDMSLVGPRPLLVEYLGKYSPRQARRHLVRPGITGLAQVSGRNSLTWEEKFEYDNIYVDNCSFLTDMKILFQTIGKVIKRSDINANGSQTMPVFNGTEHHQQQKTKTNIIEQKNGEWPYFDQEQIDAVSNVLKSGRVNYWTGEQVRDFEKEFAAYCGTKKAIAVANGTVAIELALRSVGIAEGDEVIVPSRTFIGTASAVVACGAKPVVADISSHSQAITPETIEQVRTEKTRAIIVVHVGGWAADMVSIMSYARSKGLVVIEDCAQAHGARYDGKMVGSFGDIGAYSFCQDKIMSTGGEGGMLVTDDLTIWEKAWSFKDHGKNIETIKRKPGNGCFRFVHDSFGTNWRMTEMQAALGRIQLRKLEDWVAKRRENANTIVVGLHDNDAICFKKPDARVKHSYYRLYGFVNTEVLASGWTRDKILKELVAKKVRVGVGSCGIISQEKAFDVLRQAAFTSSLTLHETSIAFCVHPTLSSEDLSLAIETINALTERAKKYSPDRTYAAA